MIGRNSEMKRGRVLAMPVVAILLYVVVPLHAAGMNGTPVQDCAINEGPCSKKTGVMTVTLDVAPKPVKAMKSLVFTVTVKGAREYDSLKLKLQMPGMSMGNNVVKLVKVGAGKYSGVGVVPKCHSGKRLWSATVEIPGATPVETAFLFDVQY